MGTFRCPVALGNPSGTEFEVLNALVDKGATYTSVPSSLLERLNVKPVRQTSLIMSDGRCMQRSIGEARIRAGGREVMTLVGDEEVMPFLSAYSLDGLGLGVDPSSNRLVDMKAYI